MQTCTQIRTRTHTHTNTHTHKHTHTHTNHKCTHMRAGHACMRTAGYYGISQNASFSEDSPMGNDYLAEVCKEWEASAKVGARTCALLHCSASRHAQSAKGSVCLVCAILACLTA